MQARCWAHIRSVESVALSHAWPKVHVCRELLVDESRQAAHCAWLQQATKDHKPIFEEALCQLAEIQVWLFIVGAADGAAARVTSMRLTPDDACRS